MSNPIPPFVCSTPPPIDCIVDAPPPVDDDFGDFAAVDDQFEASSLPVTPVHVAKLPDNASAAIPSSIPPSPDKELNYTPKDDDIVADVTVHIKPIEQDNSSYTPASSKIDLKPELPYIIEANSPPPLDFAPDDDDLTPCDDLDNDDDDEVDEFPIDDAGKYDDNISLPSLKFDSLSNVSKSTTPVSDELTKSNHEDSDSISAFAPMPSGSMDEEATVLEECTTEKTAAGDVEVKAIPFEALTISEPPEDISDQVTMSVSRQSINENDDDFTEFEAFPAAPLQNDLESAFSEPPKDDFPAAETQGTGDFAFEADFSQFSSFGPIAAVQPPVVVSQTADNTQLTEKSSLDDLDADDFDDFQDFAVAAAATPVSATPVVEQRKASIGEATTQDIPPINSDDEEEEDDDDDFGEFSEVIESETTSIPSSNSGFNLANLNDKLKPILEMMFPLANAMEEDEANHLKQLTTTSTTTTIDQIDTAKALEYQWNNSEMRHSLIKSLGVDSRNILYGEKWNSSMPRYAANLSFNPLEPMKSDKAAASSSSSTSSSTADYRKRSESLTTTSLKGDVPAVEFDWNSSGLVNPLDGVKEILHERTIEAIHTPQLGEPYPPIDQQSNSAFTSNTNVYDSNKPPSHGRFIDEETISAPIEFKSHADASAAISTATATASAAAATPVTAATASPAALSDDYINITSGDYQHHHHHSHHSSVLETNIDSVLASTQASLNHSPHAAKYQESSKTDLETELQHSVVVTTSTYAGPLKETHIFTPSKSESILARSTASKTPRTSESSKCPIDFDYEIAAAGIIIDETVVKKEYRDVEYNPGFGLKYREETEYNHSTPPDIDTFSSSYHSRAPKPPPELDDFNDFVSVVSEVSAKKASVPRSNSFDDEFSDFQSVPAPAPVSIPPTIVPSAINPSSVLAESKTSPSHLRKLKESERSLSNSRTGTPVSLSDEMILSPAILLPQAIQIESKPTIEWPEPGINPEEMARIEELFPQPKVGSNKPSPSHSGRSQPPPQQQQNRAAPDDDDWSEFVSVPASATSNHIQSISQQFQKRHASPAKSATAAADANDEEWSDFVSSAPPPANQLRQAVFPQFNSASWQNANFYNNPMSAYASPPTSFYYQPPQQQLNSSNLVPNLSSINNNTAAITNNNNIINNNNSINQYLINNQSHQQQQQHLHHQQHIQMMRDFSNSSPMDGGSIAASSIHQQFAAAGYGYKNNRGGMTTPHHGKSSQFGGASSKVAPSISLIPDLGFVAPTHTSFISVPKNSLITKK